MSQLIYIYSIVHPKHKDSVALVYFNLDKELIKIEFNELSSHQFKNAVCKNTAVNIDQLSLLRELGAVVKDITNFDISFENFWKIYAYKVGKKGRIEKIYKNLSIQDKILAFGGITKLRRFYAFKKQNLPYADTYINNRMWENEYNY